MKAMKLLKQAAAVATCIMLWPIGLHAKVDSGVRLIKGGEPVIQARDKALAIVKIASTWSTASILLMRVPSVEEISAYHAAKQAAFEKAGKKAGAYGSFVFDYRGPPNLYNLPIKKAMSRGEAALIVAELPPGEYVLYGQGNFGYLWECMCFGTVGFTLEAGRATDLGTVFIDKAWEQSTVPELASVTGLGPIARMDYGLFAVGLRPPKPGDIPVPGLDPAKVTPAKFRAVGPFVETNTLLATRLAPVAGVLRYDGGRVIDVASGAEALPN